MSDSTSQSDLQNQIEQLRDLINRLQGRIGQLENPQGRLFLADTSNPGSTHRAMAEMIPNVAGNALANLTNGRTVSGATDPGVFLAIDALGSGQRAFLGFANGNNWVYVPISEQLRYGVVQAVADCNAYCTVKESDSDGIILSDVIVTISPAPGCDTASGFCYTVGGVIAYMADPKDTTFGVQVGAYKSISIGYQCAEAEGGPTNLAHVDDLSRIEPYLTDFFIGASSTCSGPTNLAQLGWRGCIVLGYGGQVCGATNTAGTGGVKVFEFGANNFADGGSTTNSAFINFEIACASTSANVPTLGGSPCLDNSLPKKASISAYFPVGTTIDASDPSLITVAQDAETCIITVTFPTMKCLIPFA